MTDSRAALDADRLPWLTAEPKPRVATGWSLLVSWGVVVLLLVAGGAYWLGRTSEVDAVRSGATPPARDTMTLPAPVAESEPAPPAPKVELAPPPPVAAVAPQPVPKIERATARKANAATRPAKRVRSSQRAASTPRKAAAARPTVKKRSSAARPVKRTSPRRAAVRQAAWPAPPTALYLGRMIQLGTYSTRARLDRAWAYRVQRYPQLRGLPKVVVPYRQPDGVTRYRLQAMTVAPAQASWLCRKLRAEWRSCSVLRPRTANG